MIKKLTLIMTQKFMLSKALEWELRVLQDLPRNTIPRLNREIKRVPMDFKWELGKEWKGYDRSQYEGDDLPVKTCEECKEKGYECDEENQCMSHPDNRKIWYHDPPVGEGYQTWETCSEGSPISPVFETEEEVINWLMKHDTSVTSHFTTEDWKNAFEKGGFINLETMRIYIPP